MHPKKGKKKYEINPANQSLLSVIYQRDESLPPPRTLEEAMEQSPKLKEYFWDTSYRSKKFICKHLGLPPPYRKPYTRKQKAVATVGSYVNTELNNVFRKFKIPMIFLILMMSSNHFLSMIM